MCTTCGCNETRSDRHERGHRHEHEHEHEHPHTHTHTHGREHVHGPRDGARTRDESATRTLRIEQDLLAKNAHFASSNVRTLARDGIALFNLIGAPGAGKTALLEAIIRRLHTHLPVAVIEGDQATDRDAQRIEAAGCPVRQVNTGTGCHLDASMVAEGLEQLTPPRGGVVFVENVGNLVCPALFDLGEHAKIVVMSVTEGDDKPLKYPHVFRASTVFVLTKTDLLPHVPFDAARCLAHALEVNPRLRVLQVSAVTGDGLDELCGWLRLEAARALVAPREEATP